MATWLIMLYLKSLMNGFPTVRSQTIFLTAYLRSNRHKPFKKIDRETGEKFVF